ncbi:prevent-host-death family protein [Rickettsia sp. MEAM1 (Bemisia tabaci)]|uniref:type II toxin-antitoxin system Phd/YefM family antitoxin n=1 Tax=unclassified Rickettsia TaxID=114295 RepID=UPI0002E588AF|nr:MULTISPECIES: type II toxin-antitoxin system Phd/YefM family antitoxin [unclassified Rickettsia]MCC8377078.1 type II toxin-antitoxin system Phd/YefM family antitoxin [Rickettsia endosymbiont of Graphium doson]HJD67754.1 type II toxin-antitoxin system Phd/YefM family antitoxin [Rickettsia endosymbiont of Bembidion lapponicum]ASX27965.1 prevent-host-death family protein [Rickettsia sp. MEAM1 (Bemisia tabaci)]ODA37199.1 prevent-host-death family protein [Rickettsia sp. wb]ODA38624.1 prevent-ho
MNKWQLHEAKNKLSNIVDTAMQGTPQCITKRGEEAVVVISMKDYKQLTKQKLSFSEYLLSAPDFNKLDLQRVQGKARDFEL